VSPTPARVVNVTVVCRCTLILLAPALFSVCVKDSPPAKRGTATSSSSPRIDDSAAGSIDLGGAAYSASTLAAVGSVSGRIRFPDAAPADSTASAREIRRKDTATVGAVVSDSAAADSAELDTSSVDGTSPAQATIDCDAKLAARPNLGKKTLANTLVWIANVKTGKPLPMEKRADLSSENCLLDPRVQAVVVGTTLNVINDDKALHRLVFTKLGTHDTLTVTPFFNAGQMVASERLAKAPGIVEVRCAQHPATRAYIAVFDHPYFAVTEKDGSFKIDSLPPGNYRMMVWREGAAKPVEQQIQITTGGVAKVDLMLK
jgi:Carboxypeptidase regulatory-like domain